MRALFLGFAFVAYAIFFATFLYLIGFVGDLAVLPLTVDKGPAGPVAAAVITDIVLIALFGLQHSVMARQGFKRSWTRVVPWPIERSVYVLFASAALIILFSFWRPIDGVVWDGPDLRGGLVGITDLGLAVLAGQADAVRLRGFDRWLGGMHLLAALGGDVAWRYDPNAMRLVRG